ncbi:hypothetical protein [Parvularcula sp. LCG005]|uniref:hypothetical protein n=1 Tax=Parvularcula sp. LCG005 TaxID=3078805 RepID=UPI00294238C7|nr:hypothetical protein [Parvularcula sp. LCG005]WOI54717.1 hypothetical protein RUI03_06860 [Parvularcula sp. LCG005]
MMAPTQPKWDYTPAPSETASAQGSGATDPVLDLPRNEKEERAKLYAQLAPAVVSLDAYCRAKGLWDVAEHFGAILDLFDETLTGTPHAQG